ncbi:hypothetical protein GF327_04175, partial [Candidatus Woesearchaeota archaeon]|nr:hypothetical protein [Candidatus Woesearchaeota archaeon]
YFFKDAEEDTIRADTELCLRAAFDYEKGEYSQVEEVEFPEIEAEEGLGGGEEEEEPEPGPSETSFFSGKEMIELAKRALGHPYCFRPREWPIASDPPKDGSCPGHSGSKYCSVAEYENLAEDSGKCPIDSSTFVKWVINTYIKEEINDDYESNENSVLNYPYSAFFARDYGKVVDGDPEKGTYSSTEHYELRLDKLEPGDMLFFASKYAGWNMGHIGLYAGDGKIIHARAGNNGGVVLEDLQRYVEYIESGGENIYVGAKRLEFKSSSGSGSYSGECHYCGSNVEYLQDYDIEAYNQCGSKRCCKGACPPGSVILEVPYYNQCSFGMGPPNNYCYNACGPTSLKMLLEAVGFPEQSIEMLWDISGCKNGDGIRSMVMYTDYACSIGACDLPTLYRPSISKIKQKIDSGHPMLVNNNMIVYSGEACYEKPAGHYFAAVGYSDEFIIVHDPYTLSSGGRYLSCTLEIGQNLVLKKSTFQNVLMDRGYVYVVKPGET